MKIYFLYKNSSFLIHIEQLIKIVLLNKREEQSNILGDKMRENVMEN